MDFPLSNLYCVHHLPKGNELCAKYEPFAIARHTVHCAFKITDTIHYNALKTNDFSEYNRYIELAGQKDHSEKSFRELLFDLDISRMPPLEITYYAKMGIWVISDGLHRLSILKYKGLLTDRIPSAHFKLAYLHFNKKYLDSEIEAVGKALLTTTSDTLYNGWNNKRAPFGYHTYTFAGKTFAGQRNNLLRIADMKKHVDFLGKSVLDFGCNTGGLLHHLPEIAKGCGTDIDEKCMIAARTLTTTFRLHKNLTFVAANLETCDLDMFLAHGPYDIIFLCSLGSWVKNWPRLYTWAITHSPIVFFEENNATEGKPQLDYFESNGCTVKLVTANSPDDNTGNRMRNMYIVYTPLFSAK